MSLKDLNNLESYWIIGGNSLYREVVESGDLCHRIYLTKIFKSYDCDTFFPEIDMNRFKEIQDEKVDSEEQEEDGVKYCYKVFERM